MSLTLPALRTPRWGVLAFRLRVAISLTGALYGLLRFGPGAGLKIGLIAAVFVGLDAVQMFVLGRGRLASVARPVLIGVAPMMLVALLFSPAPWAFSHATPGPVLLESPLPLLLICLTASYFSAERPGLVLQVGAAMAAAWTAARLWTRIQPGIIDSRDLHPMHSVAELLAAVNAPRYFNADLWKEDLECGVAITAILALAAYRMRRLARTSAQREAQRDALAAHFSPQVVHDLLARRDQTLGPQARDVAVLECDLVGFTALAERLPPEASAELLGLYRRTAESAVFAHGGAILGWVGDGVTAVFGLNEPGAAAASALACARELHADWPKASEAFHGAAAPSLGIGIDFGPCLMGLVGTGRSVSLLLTGAPVDAAARLQAATRQCDAAILVSCAARDAIVAASPSEGASLAPVSLPDEPAWRG